MMNIKIYQCFIYIFDLRYKLNFLFTYKNAYNDININFVDLKILNKCFYYLIKG
jgi:hypothetical protein